MKSVYYKKVNQKILLNLIYLFICLLLEIFLIVIFFDVMIIIKVVVIFLIVVLLLAIIIFMMYIVNIVHLRKKLSVGELIQLDIKRIKLDFAQGCIVGRNYIFQISEQSKDDSTIEQLLLTDKMGKKSRTLDILYFAETRSFIIMNKWKFDMFKEEKLN